MKVKYPMLFVLFLLANSVFAQKDTATYYLTSTGEQVSNKDQGDFYVKISRRNRGATQSYLWWKATITMM